MTVSARLRFPLTDAAAAAAQEAENKPIRVDLVTDTASDVVLHWGVSPIGEAACVCEGRWAWGERSGRRQGEAQEGKRRGVGTDKAPGGCCGRHGVGHVGVIHSVYAVKGVIWKAQGDGRRVRPAASSVHGMPGALAGGYPKLLRAKTGLAALNSTTLNPTRAAPYALSLTPPTAGSREWVMPDDGVLPEGSMVMHKAVETPFLNCDDDECDVEISGAKVPLQRITINLPAGGWRRAGWRLGTRRGRRVGAQQWLPVTVTRGSGGVMGRSHVHVWAGDCVQKQMQRGGRRVTGGVMLPASGDDGASLLSAAHPGCCC